MIDNPRVAPLIRERVGRAQQYPRAFRSGRTGGKGLGLLLEQ